VAPRPASRPRPAAPDSEPNACASEPGASCRQTRRFKFELPGFATILTAAIFDDRAHDAARREKDSIMSIQPPTDDAKTKLRKRPAKRTADKYIPEFCGRDEKPETIEMPLEFSPKAASSEGLKASTAVTPIEYSGLQAAYQRFNQQIVRRGAARRLHRLSAAPAHVLPFRRRQVFRPRQRRPHARTRSA
jgi:hypothetical protein